MAKDLFSFECSAFPGELRLVGFRGDEGLSRPYRFEVFVTTTPPDDLADAMELSASLHVQRGGGAAAYDVHGVVVAADILHEVEDRALLRLVVEPRLSLLALTLHSRVFTQQKIPDILVQVLQDNGLGADDYELRLSKSYAVEAHVCQYQESDFDFISRWMEREGIYYFFEQGEKLEKLVLTDDKSRHTSLASGPVRYHPVAGRDHSHTASFQSFRCRRASRPASVKLKDQDYKNPSLDVSGTAPAFSTGAGEISIHGGRFFTPSDGDRLAKLRAEELMARQTVYSGGGMVFDLRPGYTFELEDHAIGAMNQRYLCVELRQRGNLNAKSSEMARLTGLDPDETYAVEVIAVAASAQYRPARATPWPEIHGFEGAVVDGPAGGPYAQIDDQGRYNVKLQFDEGTLKDGKASTPLRMMQPHGGNPEGFHFPLRKGTEVMVGFLHSDPDRPFIAGAVPNAATPSPVTSANHTRNIIHTGSDNHWELEDQKGDQWIDIKTPPKDTYLHLGKPHDGHSHYVVLHTQGDDLFEIGSNQDIDVGGKLTEKVKGAVSETYKAKQTSEVKGPQSTTVTAGVTETYQNTQMTVVEGKVTEEYHTGQTSNVSGGLRLEVFTTAQKTTVSGGELTQEFTDPHERAVTGATASSHIGTLYEHVLETTKQTYPTGVTQLWGPVESKFASLNWIIPGATTVVCPTFDVAIPLDSWQFINNTYTTTLKLQLTLLSASAYALKMARVGLSLGANGSKFDAAGLSLAIVGLDVKAATVKADSKTAKCVLYALDLTT